MDSYEVWESNTSSVSPYLHEDMKDLWLIRISSLLKNSLNVALWAGTINAQFLNKAI